MAGRGVENDVAIHGLGRPGLAQVADPSGYAFAVGELIVGIALIVFDETGDHAALIDIPLSFNAEAPDGPMPVVSKQDTTSPLTSPGKK